MSNHSVSYHLFDNDGNLWAECWDDDKAKELAARQGLYVSEILTYDPELVEDYTPLTSAIDGGLGYFQSKVPCYEIDDPLTGKSECVARYCSKHHPRQETE